MSKTNAPNREAWLSQLAEALRPRFKAAGYTVPDNIKLTCGFPSKGGLGKKTIRRGEVWRMELSKANVFEVFITPLEDDALVIASIVAHELTHTAVGIAAGHGAKFKKCAGGVGLEAPFKTANPTEAFKRWFDSQRADLGDYPHGALVPVETSGPKKQTARLIKAECPICDGEGTPYIVRAAAATLQRGTPICPVHRLPMTAELPEQPNEETEAELDLVPPPRPADDLTPPAHLRCVVPRPEGSDWANAERWEIILKDQVRQIGSGRRTVWVVQDGPWVRLRKPQGRPATITSSLWQEIATTGRRLDTVH